MPFYVCLTTFKMTDHDPTLFSRKNVQWYKINEIKNLVQM